MASLSQYYSDYLCSDEFGELPTLMTSSEGITATAMHGGATLPFASDINGKISMAVPFDSPSDISRSSSLSSSSSTAALLFPAADGHGASDMSIPATLPVNDYDGSLGLVAISGNEGNYRAGNYCHPHEQAYHHDFGDQECSVLPSNLCPIYPAINFDNWEIQGGIAQRMEDSTLNIPRYSAEERKARILRYLKKRSQRNFNKTIKYACRKTLADKRVRVRGRFAKNSECCEDDQTLMLKTDHNLQEADPCYNDLENMKPHDEEWLQEAIASFMYYSIFPDNVLELPDDKYLN